MSTERTNPGRETGEPADTPDPTAGAFALVAARLESIRTGQQQADLDAVQDRAVLHAILGEVRTIARRVTEIERRLGELDAVRLDGYQGLMRELPTEPAHDVPPPPEAAE